MPIAPDAQDRLRHLIGAELERQNALARSRQPLALLAEASIRANDETVGPGYLIVDANGLARTREDEAGVTVLLTISDLVGELRGEHPALFQGESGTTSLASPVAPASDGEVDREPSTVAQAAAEREEVRLSSSAPNGQTERDWILLAAPGPTMPAARNDTAAIEMPPPPPSGSVVDALPDSRPAAPSPAELRAAPAPMRRPREPRILTVAEARPPRAAMLPPAWMPSRTTWLRLLYVAAFVGGLMAYSAVRHLT